MNGLIDRQKAIDALDQIFDRCEEIEAHLPEGDPDRTGYKMYPDYMTVWKFLRQLPSAQPETHYCRECKWSWCHINVGKHGEIETYWRCLNWDGETDEEGYCHEWERRTDETD